MTAFSSSGSPAPRPANSFIRFSTGEFPQAERFQRFRDDLVRRLHWDAVELPDSDADFIVDYLVSFPVVVIAARKMSAARLFRAGDVTDAKGARFVLVCNTGHEHMEVGSNGALVRLQQGSAMLLDCRGPADIKFGSGSSRALLIEPAALTNALPITGVALNRPIAADHPALSLLLSYLEAMDRTIGHIDRRTIDVIGRHMVDLVACAVGTSGELGPNADSSGVRAARLATLLAFIEEHASRAGLSARAAATHLHLSERYVHLLFEETGRSFSETVLETRLLLAHRQILTPSTDPMTLHDVSASVGFRSTSYFNRVYKRRFGETPSETRRRSLRNQEGRPGDDFR